MAYTPQEIGDACISNGNFLSNLPNDVTGSQLLWGLAGVESSFGKNLGPRHEPAFDVGGSFYKSSNLQQQLVSQYGSAAACSYGPWQIMFSNAPFTYKPKDLEDLGKVTSATVLFLNSVLRRFKPKNLGEIGQCWNGGHIFHGEIPSQIQNYVEKLAMYYKFPILVTK